MMGMDTHEHVLTWRNLLSDAERSSKAGEITRAEDLYRQALALAEKGGGLNDQELVTSLIHLADFYFTHRSYDRSEPLYRRALSIYERIFGTENFISAICMRSLGEVLDAQGKAAEAADIRKRSREILQALQRVRA